MMVLGGGRLLSDVNNDRVPHKVPPANITKENPPIMRKSIVIAALASTVGGMAAGALLSTPNLANAATTDTTVAASSAAPAVKADKVKGSGVESTQKTAAAKALGTTEAELATALQGGKTIAQVAADKGVAVDKVISAMVDDVKAQIAAQLAAGTITQAKADEELAEEPKETTDKVNNVNQGRGGKGGHGGSGVESGQNAVAAKILGMTDAELSTALQGGKTLAQLATEKNVPVNTLVTAMVDDVKTKVASALAAGTITQAKATEELAEEPTETTDKVNAVQTGRQGGGKGGHDGQGKGGNKGTATTKAAATATA
jgi:hypothetical protein